MFLFFAMVILLLIFRILLGTFNMYHWFPYLSCSILSTSLFLQFLPDYFNSPPFWLELFISLNRMMTVVRLLSFFFGCTKSHWCLIDELKCEEVRVHVEECWESALIISYLWTNLSFSGFWLDCVSWCWAAFSCLVCIHMCSCACWLIACWLWMPDSEYLSPLQSQTHLAAFPQRPPQFYFLP